MIKAYHAPVLLHETVEGLNIKPGGIYVDVTYGGGGHSEHILSKLKRGKLIAFDQDSEALENADRDKRLLLIHGNFRYLKNYLRYHKIEHVDGILADLGVSSHHFDSPARGFSYRYEGDLDMRMNEEANLTAKMVLNTYTEEQLIKIFSEYGEVKNCRKLVNLITSYRNKTPISKVNEFIQLIKECLPKRNQNKYLSKVFQSLRIEVNQEIEALRRLLIQVAEVLKSGGRLAIITYHSVEDRIVKNFIRAGNFNGIVNKDIYGNIIVPLRAVNKNVIVPCPKEVKDNKRARSAKLRIAEKI